MTNEFPNWSKLLINFSHTKELLQQKKMTKAFAKQQQSFSLFWFRFFFVNVGNSCANNVVAASVSFLQKGYN